MDFRRYATSTNSLGFKVSLCLLVVSVVPLIVYLSLNRLAMVNHFSQLEKSQVRFELRQAVTMMQADASSVSKVTKDYAIWDEPYFKVQERDQDWFRENVTKWLPENSGIDLIVVADKQRRIVDLFGTGTADAAELLNDPEITQVLKPEVASAPDRYPRGLKMYRGDLYVVSVSPFLRNFYKGTPGGLLILGRKVTTPRLNEMGRIQGYKMLVSYGDKLVSGSEISPEVKQYVLAGHENQDVHEINNTEIIGQTELKKFDGTKLGDLFIIQSRQPYLSAVYLINRNGYLAFGLSILTIVLLSVKLQKLIVAPIKGLEEQISQMGDNNVLGYVAVAGSDEISSLASAFNRMTTGLLSYKKQNESLKTISITDELTALYNHRYFFEYFKMKLLGGTKQLTMLFCDIDHFKVINDVNGHISGDFVLGEIAGIIKKTADELGAAFRYGGEEFVILLDDITPYQAFRVAETIRLEVARSKGLDRRSGYLPVTISIGIAGFPGDALNVETLIENADRAMYYAKQNGRNQTQIYSPDMDTISDRNLFEYNRHELLLDSAYTLAAVIDAKDPYTERHSEAVIKYALQLAEKINLTEQDRQILRIGGLLHDVGKIGIPDEILHKSQPLTPHDWQVIKNHPLLGCNIAKHVIKTPEIEACIKYHHERWDGQGYPEGLAGHDIPLYARIICIADSYHAMVSDRPHRKALTPDEALDELHKNRGIKFDPELVGLFIKAISESNFDDTGADSA